MNNFKRDDNNMIKIVICDDEDIYIQKAKEIVKNIANTEICKYSCEEKLISDINNNLIRADIYIIDIEMPKVSGMEIARIIKEKYENSVVIFLTNYDKYVFDAFEVSAFRYIQKSKMNEKLRKAIEDAIVHIEKINKNIYITLGGTRTPNRRIKLNSIISIEKVNKYAEFHINDGSLIRDRDTLSNVYEKLNFSFVEIRKGVIVNIEHIKLFDRQRLVMDDGSVQYISRDKLKFVKEKIMKFWGE
ncbi:MAG: LytR/AlgR family response regulator transcription factor [Lachnospirales bacterium]